MSFNCTFLQIHNCIRTDSLILEPLPFVVPEETVWFQIKFLQWCHLGLNWLKLKTTVSHRRERGYQTRLKVTAATGTTHLNFWANRSTVTFGLQGNTIWQSQQFCRILVLKKVVKCSCLTYTLHVLSKDKTVKHSQRSKAATGERHFSFHGTLGLIQQDFFLSVRTPACLLVVLQWFSSVSCSFMISACTSTFGADCDDHTVWSQ